MATPTTESYNPLKQLRVLFKLLNSLGLTGVPVPQSDGPPFTLNVKPHISKFLKYLCGCIVLKLLVTTLVIYITRTTYRNLKAVNNQEETIAEFLRSIRTVSAFLYASNYLREHYNLLTLFNEAVRVFKELMSRTEPELHFGSQIVVLFTAQVIVLTFILNVVIAFTLTCLVMWCVLDFDFTLLPIFNAFMVVSHVYVQLTLLCFFEISNEILRSFRSAKELDDVSKCVREFIAISERLHALRQRINGFYNSVFISTYIGLFHDTEYIYLTLKSVLYSKYFLDHRSRWLHPTFHYFPACLSFTFDMFIFGILSDMLEDANEKFQKTISKLSSRTPSLEREVDLMLLRENLGGVGFEAFGHATQFSFDFMMNIALMFVIMFMQFFAAEEIYMQHFAKIKMTREQFYM